MLDTLIVSPEDIIFQGQSQSISVPGINGDFAIYPQHCALLSTLKAGTVIIHVLNGPPEVIYLESGTVAVRDNHVKIFADIAFKAREAQEAKLLQEKATLESKLDNQMSAINTQELLSQLSKLNAQLQAIHKLRKHKVKR